MFSDMETIDREYKETFGDSVLKAICAMANTKGGEVIVGVADNGEVKGIEIDNKALERITQKIIDKLGLHPQIEVKEKNGKKIIVITTQKSKVPISFNGRYYERVGNTTREMRAEKLRQFFLKEANWDSLVNREAEFEEIDKKTVRMFIRMANAMGRFTVFDENVDIKALFEHLKLSNKGRLTNAAIVLFGKDLQKYF
ncbi:AlbA family DNA-binding domain-containing protein [Desulfothermus sp.]